jgi:uncharacterized protein
MPLSFCRFPVRVRARAQLLLALFLLPIHVACTAIDPVPEGSASPSATASQDVTPPFFRVYGRNGSRLDIMGTIHLGPSEGWNFSPQVTDALAAADSFMLEIDLRSLDEDQIGNVLASMVILPIGTTLDDVVSPETAKLLDEHDASLAKIGFPRGARRHKKPWYLVTSIVALDSQKIGFDLNQSAEAFILAAAGDRPLLGLETFESQLRLMDDLSPEIQDTMLRDTLERRHEAAAEIQTLIAAWRSNDQHALAGIAIQGLDEFPELVDFYDALLKNRNQRWVETLSRILDDPGRRDERVFVGVGALHLVGQDSLIDLLRKAGYRVQAIHPDGST